MTLPRKGSRAISVGDHNYRWIVSPDSGTMLLVVERSDTNGQRLEVTMTYEDDPVSGQATRITPSTVRQWIERALDRGWMPDRVGAEPFTIR